MQSLWLDRRGYLDQAGLASLLETAAAAYVLALLSPSVTPRGFGAIITAMSAHEADVTTLLERWNAGDVAAFEELVPIVYGELRKLSASYLRRESDAATLQPTALVHEVYLRLAGERRVRFENRRHFYGAAATIIRRLLVDHAREKHAEKRGGDREKVALDFASAIPVPRDVDLVALDQALEELSRFDPDKARIVELRYFAGLSIPETAEVLNTSPTSLKREWALARAWLYERLHSG